MAKLALRHLYKVYPNGVKAVSDFTMDIADKEFIVFVGPSGCGKSTTLRMIAGLEDITAGELYIGDKLVNELEPKDRDISMVFQNYALFPHMSVFENMAFGLRVRKLPKEEIEKKVSAAAEILGITQYLETKPRNLSGGQRQRVALGRAIVREPSVFLLDEPLSNLDAKLRAQMRTEIKRLHNKLGTTFIYVTHDQVEAMTMGDRIVVMRDGFVQQIDTPVNLYNNPANKFVAAFIGTPQINLFDAKLKKSAGGARLLALGHDVRLAPEHIEKVTKGYLDGETEITAGIRSEHISVSKKAVEGSVRAEVTLVEELGGEQLVYCDVDNQTIVVKTDTKEGYTLNETVYLTFDKDKLLFFDKETEVSIKPEMPLFDCFNTVVKNGNVDFMDGKALQSEAVISRLSSCEGKKAEIVIPTDAFIISDNGVSAEVKNIEKVNGGFLHYLKSGGFSFFALFEKEAEAKTVALDVDESKISIICDDQAVVKPLPETNRVDAKFLRRRVKDGKKTITKYYLSYLCGEQETDETFTSKMFSKGSAVFKMPLKLEFSPQAVEFRPNGFNGAGGIVKSVAAYSEKRYAFIECDDSEIVAQTQNAVNSGDAVSFALNLDSVKVFDAENDIPVF